MTPPVDWHLVLVGACSPMGLVDVGAVADRWQPATHNAYSGGAQRTRAGRAERLVAPVRARPIARYRGVVRVTDVYCAWTPQSLQPLRTAAIGAWLRSLSPDSSVVRDRPSGALGTHVGAERRKRSMRKSTVAHWDVAGFSEYPSRSMRSNPLRRRDRRVSCHAVSLLTSATRSGFFTHADCPLARNCVEYRPAIRCACSSSLSGATDGHHRCHGAVRA